MALKLSTKQKLINFGLTEGQIDDILLEDSLLSSSRLLRYILMDKWNLPLNDAVELVKKLKEEEFK